MTLALCLLLAAAQEGNWKLDEGSGSSANDSAHAHHGALVGPPAWTPGRVGNALDFDLDYVDIPDHDALTPGTALTIAAWIRLDAVSEDYDSIVNKWSQSTQEEYLFGIQMDRKLALAWHTTGSNTWGTASYNVTTSAGTVPLGGWTHVGVVRNASSLTFYIGGVPAGASTPMDANPFKNGTDSLRIGGQNRGGESRYFDGKIDEVRLYPSALSASDMAALASLPPNTDLEARWPLAGNALDSVDTHHGTLVGNPVFLSDALDLDGQGDYVQVPDRDDLTAGTEATIAAWIFPESVSEPTGLVVIAGKWAHTNAGDEILLSLTTGRQILAAWHTTSAGNWGVPGYNAAQTSQTVPLSFWSHAAFVRNGTSVKIFLNGIEAYSGEPADANPFQNGHRPWNIGAENSNESPYWGQVNRWFDGAIKDVRYYTRALTAPEIALLAIPTPTVTLAATDPEASEYGLDPGTFTLTRTGPTTSPLTILYSIEGTAQSGTDYASIAASATIPAGSSSLPLAITPLQDAEEEGDQTVLLTLSPDPAYQIGSPSSATVTIGDDDLPPEADLEGRWKLDDAVGPTAVDSAHSHHGTLIGNPVWTSGKLGGALDLDGTGDYIRVPDSDALTAGTALTLSAWIRPDAVADGTIYSGVGLDTIAGKWSHATAGDEVFLGLDTNRKVVFSWHTTGEGFGTWATPSYNWVWTDQAVPLSTWTHLAATRNGPSIKIYLNGAQAYSGTPADSSPFHNSHRDLHIGAEDSTESAYWGQVDRNFDGKLDDVRLYTRALSAAEIAVLATPLDPEGHWKLDDGAGLTALDSSGHGHDGTLLNGPVWTPGTLSFDGTDDRVSIPDSPDLTAGTRLTLAAWVYPDQIVDDWDFGFGETDFAIGRWSFSNSADAEFFLAVNEFHQAVFSWHTTGGSTWGTPSNHWVRAGTVPFGAWCHIAGVRDGTSVKLYVGGVQVHAGSDADANPYVNSPLPVMIGAQAAGNGNRYWDGKLDDVRLYTRALSAAEIAELATPPAELPSVTIAATDPDAAEAGLDPGTFTVTRTGDTTNPLTVTYTVDLGPSDAATPVDDYATLSMSVEIPAAQGMATITVTPVDDADVEGNERVMVSLSTDPAYTVGSPSTAEVTIVSDDLPPLPPTVTLVATDAAASEQGPDAGTFTVSRNGDTTGPLTVYFSISGIAVNGTDYSSISSPVTIPASATSTTITITPVDDSEIEDSEAVILTLTTDAAYTIGTPSGDTVTITDNDDVPPPPNPPVLLSAVPGESEVTLSWSAPAGATVYNLFRSESPGAPYEIVVATGIAQTSFVDGIVTNGTTYYYVVTALNAVGESGYSNELFATPGAPLPPLNVRTLAYHETIDVEWDPSPSSGVAGYNVYRKIGTGGSWVLLNPSAVVLGTKYRDVPLIDGQQYCYYVTAVGE